MQQVKKIKMPIIIICILLILLLIVSLVSKCISYYIKNKNYETAELAALAQSERKKTDRVNATLTNGEFSLIILEGKAVLVKNNDKGWKAVKTKFIRDIHNPYLIEYAKIGDKCVVIITYSCLLTQDPIAEPIDSLSSIFQYENANDGKFMWNYWFTVLDNCPQETYTVTIDDYKTNINF